MIVIEDIERNSAIKLKNQTNYKEFEQKQHIEVFDLVKDDCTICFNNKQNAIVIECGHSGLCFECGIELLKETNMCPYCRNEVKAVCKYQKTSDNSIVQCTIMAVNINNNEDKMITLEKLMPTITNDIIESIAPQYINSQ